jgi:hypothetical protein
VTGNKILCRLPLLHCKFIERKTLGKWFSQHFILEKGIILLKNVIEDGYELLIRQLSPLAALPNLVRQFLSENNFLYLRKNIKETVFHNNKYLAIIWLQYT